jgi:formylmethanofuran dehydrogenase subunit C
MRADVVSTVCAAMAMGQIVIDGLIGVASGSQERVASCWVSACQIVIK